MIHRQHSGETYTVETYLEKGSATRVRNRLYRGEIEDGNEIDIDSSGAVHPKIINTMFWQSLMFDTRNPKLKSIVRRVTL